MEPTSSPHCSALMTSAHVQTPPSVATLHQPLDSLNDTHGFDILDALLDAGVPHIVVLIMSFFDVKELALAEQVRSRWRDIMVELLIWKHAIQRKTQTSPLWKGLFERREWLKYLSQDTTTTSVNNFFRQLYRSASKEIQSLEENWSNGHYTLTRIETDSDVCCIQYDSEKIVSGHGDNTIKIWDRRTLDLKSMLHGHKNVVFCLQLNKEVILSGSGDNSVKVWDNQTGQMVNELLHHKGDVRSLKFNSELLVSGSSDMTVAVWVFKSPTAVTLQMVLKGHNGGVYAVDLTDSYIISGSWDTTIKVWDRSTGRLLRTLQHHFPICSLCCRESLIVSGCMHGMIRLWNPNTGASHRSWRGHRTAIPCIAVDDKKIVTGSFDQTVKVWSAPVVLEHCTSSDAFRSTTMKHTEPVRGTQFDDFQIFSCGIDCTICIYDFLDPVPVDPIIAC